MKNIFIIMLTVICLFFAVFVYGFSGSGIFQISSGQLALSDSFTASNGTLLSNHQSESNHTWTRHSSFAHDLYISSNRVYSSGVYEHIYYSSYTPSSANYVVVTNIYVYSNAGYGGVSGRLDTGSNTGYRILISGTSLWLYRYNNGTPTQLGDTASITASNSTLYEIKLSMINSTIKAYFDGVEKVSVVDDAPITDKGKVGVYQYAGGSTSGFQTDSITVVEY